MADIQLTGFDHCEFWVANAKQAAYYYCRAFGFRLLAYRGLETGYREAASYVLEQDRIRLVLTSPYGPESKLNAHIQSHGDGVRDVAFGAKDARLAWKIAVDRGAKSVLEPTVLEDEHGSVVVASIGTFGDTVHTFVQRNDYSGLFLPGYEAPPFSLEATANPGLVHIDHIVGNQPDLEMEPVVQWYEKILEFHRYWTVDDKDISTEYSALRSIVVANDNEKIKDAHQRTGAGFKEISNPGICGLLPRCGNPAYRLVHTQHY